MPYIMEMSSFRPQVPTTSKHGSRVTWPSTHQSIGRSVTSERESASCDQSVAVTQVNVSARAARRGIDVSERLYVLHDMRLGNTWEDLSLLCHCFVLYCRCAAWLKAAILLGNWSE